MLKLRCSYSPAEWRGKFNYKDMKNLNTEVKDLVNYKRHSWNNGIFHISFRDFVQFFEAVNICHYRNTHSLSSLQDIISSHNQISYYQFHIKKTRGNPKNKTDLENIPSYFGVSQVSNFITDRNYQNLSLIIVRLNEDKTVEFVCGNGGAQRDVWSMKEGAKEGKYLAIVINERSDAQRKRQD